MVSPLFIFLFSWAVQFAGHVIFADDFYPFADDTWWILGTALVSFAVGCGTSLVFYAGYRKPCAAVSNRETRAGKFTFLMIFLGYALFGLPAMVNAVLDSGSIAGARSFINESIQNRDGTTIAAYYASSLLVVFSLFIFSMASRYSKSFLCFVFLSALIAAVSSSGRTLLLLLFIGTSVSLYIQGKIRLRSLLLVSLIFSCIFIGLAVLNDKGDPSDGLSQQVAWNLKVYLLNGLACFNSFVAESYPKFNGSLLLPSFIANSLPGNTETPPLILPFSETPLPGNVYTALYPWYHDGGIIGVAIGFFMIGLANQILYNGRKRSTLFRFFYSMSAYALVMTVFQDQYLQAYPLWVMALASALITSALSLFMSRLGVMKAIQDSNDNTSEQHSAT